MRPRVMLAPTLCAALAFATGSCEFAKKHPGVTTGIVAGTIGFGTCWINVEKPGTCAIIGGGVGLVLGGIMGLVTTFADGNAHELPADDEPVFVRQKEPPPDAAATIDAGVPSADAGAPVAP